MVDRRWLAPAAGGSSQRCARRAGAFPRRARRRRRAAAHRGRAEQRRLRARGRIRARGARAVGGRIVRPRDPGPPRRTAADGADGAGSARGVARAAAVHRSRADRRRRSDAGRAGVRARGRRRVAQAAARGRRAAARARQAASRVPARAHARPAGPERLQRDQGRARGRGPRISGRRWTRWCWSRSAIRRSSCSATRSWRRRRGRSVTTPTRTSPSSGCAPPRCWTRVRRGPRARGGRRAGGGRRRAYRGAPGERDLRRRARLPATRRVGVARAGGGVRGGAAARGIPGREDRGGPGQTRHPDQRGSEPAADPAARRRCRS